MTMPHKLKLAQHPLCKRAVVGSIPTCGSSGVWSTPGSFHSFLLSWQGRVALVLPAPPGVDSYAN